MTLSLEQQLLKASLLCGMKPDGPPAYRLQLFFIVNKDLHSKSHQSDLQRALETGVDPKGLWQGKKGSGEYRITQHGYQAACAVFPNVRAKYTPAGRAGYQCTLRGTIDAHTVVLRTKGTRSDVFVDDEQCLSAKAACRKIERALGCRIPTGSESAVRVLYNLAVDHGFEMVWEGPTPGTTADTERPETDLSEPALQKGEEVIVGERFLEGSVRQIRVNAYERSPEARRACIKHYGPKCMACGIIFGDAYGDAAEGFIHVHHLVPLSEVSADYTIDPITDLRPVCPNCHAVIHLRTPPFTIEEIQKMIRRKRDRPVGLTKAFQPTLEKRRG